MKEAKKQQKNSVKKIILAVILISILVVSNIFFMCFRIFSDSMSPYLNKGDYVVSIKLNNYKQGDVILFERDGKILVRRIIANSGQKIDFDENGNVFIDDKLLHEPYITLKSLDPCNIDLPYNVTENNFFVMGDNRKESLDSRTNTISFVKRDEILGKVFLRNYPFKNFMFVR
ncbi:signal peptidase I [Anaerosphaera multitolerans]|uniref:Signal peptidase I n=1 Tax=Anaerosphaera multitolerans TaxID=2487351 RepID=A0A437S651_9FIRM|nr:signal peptidase I [Anaerosphaera multitolerans]RVU54447.1 signal peptidase I [Anaerosphaera multitolerans]